MKKVRILVDVRCVSGEGQGILTYLKGLYNAFHKQYNDSYELYFAGHDIRDVKECFPFMKTSEFIKVPNTNRFRLFWKIFPEIIEKNNIDYAHFQYVTPFRKKCKYICTTHDVLFLDFPEEFSFSYRLKRKFLFKNSLQNSEIRLSVSNYSRERISHFFNIEADSIKVTPNAVHPKFLKAFDKDVVKQNVKNKFNIDNYLLYVSRIEKRKNQKLLLESYERQNLAAKGIQLVLVGNDTLGDTNTPQEIERLKAKYPGMVHWFSGIDEADLLDIYRAARLFVYPSLAEGFGIPPIEAAAVGVETLCSDKTAMQDFSFFGVNHFDPTDEAGFDTKLRLAIENPANDVVNQSKQEFIKNQYSWNIAANVIHDQILATTEPKDTKVLEEALVLQRA